MVRIAVTSILSSRALLTLAVFTVLTASTAPATAQDAHYWTNQFGQTASLLGGAVIGSADDISATFYNPGALSIDTDLSFAVSANVLEMSSVTLEDGGGSGVDLSSNKTGFRPSLVAGTFTRNLFGKDILAYSLLTRARGTIKIGAQLLLEEDDLPPEDNLTDVIALGSITGDFEDFWGGLTYSTALSERVGLGVTWYGAVRTQERRRDNTFQSLGNDGSGTITNYIAGGNYQAIRTLLKFGGYFATGSLTAGLTVTTPSLHITGSGELGTYSGAVDTDGTSLAASVQTDLAAEYHSPLSVGGGLAWRIGRSRIHASAEWFDSVAPYVAIDGQDFETQEPPVTVSTQVVQAQDQVFNWGLGFEHAFTATTNGYISFYTDRSHRSPELEQADLSLTTYDIYSGNLGVEFKVSRVLLTFGGGFSWGSQVSEVLTDLLQDDTEDFEAKIIYRSFRFLFGFRVGV